MDSFANITKTDIRLSLIVISTDAGAIQLGIYMFMFYKQTNMMISLMGGDSVGWVSVGVQ